ncbi:MAG: hypothetical protein ACYS1C_04070, partial [Planctomycetota bacterium]
MEFIKRIKLWIILGLMALVSGVVFGVWFMPSKAENSERLGEWRQKVTEVQGVKQEDLRNEADIKQMQALKQQYSQDLKRLKELLKEKDDLLERAIPNPEGEEGPLEAGRWKILYDQQMTALQRELNKSFPSSSVTVARRYYGPEWPTAQEMRQEGKNYWRQRLLFEALAEANSVRTTVLAFSGFQFTGTPERLLHPSHNELFDPVAFQME